MKERELYLDTVAGLLIIHMILGHIFQWCNLTDISFYQNMNILFFFMPWFFFKAGMFFKIEDKRDIIQKIWKRYLRPFFVFTLIGQFLYSIKLYQNGYHDIMYYVLIPIKELVIWGSTMGNLPLWFLISLSVVVLLEHYFYKKMQLIGFVAILIACILNYYQYDNIPLYMGNICTGLFFYSIGYNIRNLQYKNIIFIISIVGYFAIYIFSPSFVDMRSNKLICGNYLIWIIFSIMGIIVINNIFKRVRLINKFYLDEIGRNSIIYYVLHWIMLIVISIILNALGIEDKWNVFFIILVSCIVLLPLVTIYFRRYIKVLL